MAADAGNDPNWPCDGCRAPLTTNDGTWQFPVFHVEELLKPVLEENSRDGRSFCSRSCLADYYTEETK